MRTINPNWLIYLGMKGAVVALDRRTGAEYWRTPLKGGDFVNVVFDNHVLFAAARGEVFCLDPATGRILWHNPLKGMGWGLITIAGDGIAPGANLPQARQHFQQQQQQAASG